MSLNKLFFTGLLFCLLSGCGDKRDNKQILVLNVLDQELYSDCHIRGSVNVPLDNDNLEEYVKDLDLNREIVVYCSNYFCTASQYAAELLQKLGFKQVYAYEAGMAEWRQRGLPIDGPAVQDYLTRVIAPPKEHATNIKIITTDELAVKMGLKIS